MLNSDLKSESIRLQSPRVHRVYILAIFCVLIATGIRSLLDPFLDNRAPFLINILAIMLSSWIGGLGSGLLATIISALLANFLFIKPIYSLNINEPAQMIQWMLFSTIGVFIAVFFEFIRQHERRIEAKHEEIQQSQENFQLLVDSTLDYTILKTDPFGRIETWNQAAARMFGYQETEIIGQAFTIFYQISDNAPETLDQKLSEALKLGKKEEENQLIRKDGSRFFAHLTIIPIYRSLKEHIGFVKLVKNISEQRRDHEALDDREQKYRTLSEVRISSILTNIIEGIIMIDERGIIEMVNPFAERIFGYSANELVGQSISKIFGSHFKEKILSSSPLTQEEIFGQRKDGFNFPIEVSFGEIMLDGHRHFTGIVRDISERKCFEKKLKQARDEAESANRVKSTFLAHISHEIRTPLNTILGFSELIKMKTLGEKETDEAVEIVIRNGRSLSRLIDDLLDLSKVEAGKLTIEKTSVSIAHTIFEVEKSLELQAKEKNIALTSRLDPRVPEFIETDPNRLRQILMNLVGNAIKFTEKGQVEISVGILGHDFSSLNMPIYIDIRDTGCGIDHDLAQILFQPFTQAQSPSAKNYRGTGLGLALSRQLARLLSGNVELLASAPGKGSTFRITINEVADSQDCKSQ